MQRLKILVSAWGSTGDVLPPIAVGAALRRRGHEVSFVGNPVFERPAREAGLTMIPVGRAEDHRRMMDDVELFDSSKKSPLSIFDNYYFPQMRQFHAAADEAMRDGAQLLLGGELGSINAAEQHGLPWMMVACSPSSNPHVVSQRDPPHPEWMLPAWARPLARHGLGMALYYRLRVLRTGRLRLPGGEASPLVAHPTPIDFRTTLGLPPQPRITPEQTLCMWPAWFARSQPDQDAGCAITGFALDPRPIPAANDSPRRLIVVTTGSMASGQRDYLARAAQACALLGRPGLLVTPNAGNVPDALPGGVQHVAHAPFNELLGRAALLVHHGGIGTIAYSMAAGVPQLMTPMRGDQFDNANRVQRLGVGEMFSARDATAQQIARLMQRQLDSPDVARRCAALKRRIEAEDGLQLAADLVESSMYARMNVKEVA
jgi:rhamnosyltransferase subunit B